MVASPFKHTVKMNPLKKNGSSNDCPLKISEELFNTNFLVEKESEKSVNSSPCFFVSALLLPVISI